VGNAILSAGKHGSIGPITNSGKIIGNVEIGNQNVTVYRRSGQHLRVVDQPGAITIGNGNLTFAGGKTALGVDISVNGGNGSVDYLLGIYARR
jgi:hypothetical protein